MLRLCDLGSARQVRGKPFSEFKCQTFGDLSDHGKQICSDGLLREPASPFVTSRSYRAPELLCGATKFGAQPDVWALGCTLGMQ